jgi:hypothetical protein
MLAGIQALVMRLAAGPPGLELLTPEQYNQFFTMHGTTMMFLFAVPVMEGIGIYLIPLMIGARDMVFPRLNAFGYWVYLIAGVTLYWASSPGRRRTRLVQLRAPERPLLLHRGWAWTSGSPPSPSSRWRRWWRPSRSSSPS